MPEDPQSPAALPPAGRQPAPAPAAAPAAAPTPVSAPAHEIGGPRGLEPTRYGDWERNGRCIDF